MWVLDTDTLSLWLRGHPTVLQRVRAHEGDHLFVTIVTIEEVLGGWYALIRHARDDEQLVRAYRWLQQSVEFFSATRILSLESTTLARFRQLRREHRRIGTNDLRIAASCSNTTRRWPHGISATSASSQACAWKIGAGQPSNALAVEGNAAVFPLMPTATVCTIHRPTPPSAEIGEGAAACSG